MTYKHAADVFRCVPYHHFSPVLHLAQMTSLVYGDRRNQSADCWARLWRWIHVNFAVTNDFSPQLVNHIPPFSQFFAASLRVTCELGELATFMATCVEAEISFTEVRQENRTAHRRQRRLACRRRRAGCSTPSMFDSITGCPARAPERRAIQLHHLRCVTCER